MAKIIDIQEWQDTRILEIRIYELVDYVQRFAELVVMDFTPKQKKELIESVIDTLSSWKTQFK